MRRFIPFIAGVALMSALLGIMSGALGVFYVGTGQIQSGVTTGTAPITVASTTKVTGLNADYLNGLNSSQLTNNPGNWTCTVRSATPTCTGNGCTVTKWLNCSTGEVQIGEFGYDMSIQGCPNPLQYYQKGNGWYVQVQNTCAGTMQFGMYIYCCS